MTAASFAAAFASTSFSLAASFASSSFVFEADVASTSFIFAAAASAAAEAAPGGALGKYLLFMSCHSCEPIVLLPL